MWDALHQPKHELILRLRVDRHQMSREFPFAKGRRHFTRRLIRQQPRGWTIDNLVQIPRPILSKWSAENRSLLRNSAKCDLYEIARRTADKRPILIPNGYFLALHRVHKFIAHFSSELV